MSTWWNHVERKRDETRLLASFVELIEKFRGKIVSLSANKNLWNAFDSILLSRVALHPIPITRNLFVFIWHGSEIQFSLNVAFTIRNSNENVFENSKHQNLLSYLYLFILLRLREGVDSQRHERTVRKYFLQHFCLLFGFQWEFRRC